MRTPSQSTLWQAHSTDGGGSFAAAPHPTNLISFQSPVLVLRVSGGATSAATAAADAGPPPPPPIVLVFNNARPTATRYVLVLLSLSDFDDFKLQLFVLLGKGSILCRFSHSTTLCCRSASGETYRSILHAAISLDDGNTWRGFREVMRDDVMRGSHDDTSDHGTACECHFRVYNTLISRTGPVPSVCRSSTSD